MTGVMGTGGTGGGPNGIAADWIAVDWGTSNLRVWAMDAGGRVLAARASDRGMDTISRADYAGVLNDLVGDWAAGTTLPVVVCGMAGARQGWVEAPYRAVPCPPLGPPLGPGGVVPPDAGPRLRVTILPGLSQADPPDVMRGEETQIAGVLAHDPEFDGTLCLPGTHCKWVRLAQGRVISFRTAMTGELFALLTRHSVLRHGLEGGNGEGDDDPAFDAAVAQALATPGSLVANLFALRAGALLHALPPATARARLSGWLIGTEIAAIAPQGAIAILGAGRLARLYARALTQAGHAPRLIDADTATLAGLMAARAMLPVLTGDPRCAS